MHIPPSQTWKSRGEQDGGQRGLGSKVKEAEQDHSPNLGKPGSGEHQGRLQGQDNIKEGSLEGKTQLASVEESSVREDERKGRRQENKIRKELKKR